MRQVCYIIKIVKTTQTTRELEEIVFFGTLEQVFKDLQKAESIQEQSKIAHATDPEMIDLADVKLQTIRQLMRHDLDKLPKYPITGTAEAKFRGAMSPTLFHLELRVSIRGDKDSTETEFIQPVNIILPPGVRM